MTFLLNRLFTMGNSLKLIRQCTKYAQNKSSKKAEEQNLAKGAITAIHQTATWRTEGVWNPAAADSSDVPIGNISNFPYLKKRLDVFGMWHFPKQNNTGKSSRIMRAAIAVEKVVPVTRVYAPKIIWQSV
ncbi:hypothetical protein B0H63DRAFT_515624 [Podospora didyma]|uniref:Uncharacterized protein n=1 Tax=Podospora didyma TaxID=330526 RepID=A0AAE0K0S4_9PEZI|nr:hypothetical protein B0H63DRAFT_515624 [Podospora didyma]